MATKTSTHRLRKEFRNITREPPPHITARPLPSNILKWYFVLEGPSGTPYEGGIYMGKLHFPEQYPYKPPAVYMCTPQGRFKCNQKLCLSMSDFHPETWNPLWSVSAVLTGLLSFMLGGEETVGSYQTTVAQKCKLARVSHTFNRNDKIFQQLFPEFVRDSPPPVVPAQRKVTEGGGGSSGTVVGAQLRGGVGVGGVGGAVGVGGGAGGREGEGESLVSLLVWLVLFVAFIFGLCSLIVGGT